MKPGTDHIHARQDDHDDGRGQSEESQQGSRRGADVALTAERPAQWRAAPAESSAVDAGRPAAVGRHLAGDVRPTRFGAHTRHVIHRTGSHWRVARDRRRVVTPAVVL